MKNYFFLLMFFVFLGCNPPLPEADVSITKNADPTSPSGSASITVSTIAGRAILGASIDDRIINGTLGDARFGSTGDIVRDSAGNFFMSETSSHVIRKITPAGVVTTFAGLAGTSGTSDGTGASARFNQPTGLTIDGADILYVADYQNNAIRKITPSGDVTTIVSTGLNGPFDIVIDSVNNIFITEAYQVKKYNPGTDVISVFAGDASNPGSNNGNGINASFNNLKGITIDPTNDDLYVADSDNQLIRKITSGADVTDFSGGSVYWEYITLTTSPLTIYANNTNSLVRIDSGGNKNHLAGLEGEFITSDNVGTNARFQYPKGLALDSVTGTLHIAQDGGVRSMNLSSGSVTSFVGALGNLSTINGQGSSVRFNAPAQVAKDSQGNLFVAEVFSHCIRKITPSGVVSTFAGLAGTSGTSDGNGASARFSMPLGIVIDSTDNLYVADAFNHAIRKITPTGDVTTLAGSPGNPGYSDGFGTGAIFAYPWALTIDSSENLFVADGSNSLIRKITPAGVVTTIAGTPGASGHVDGPALTANLGQINGISISSSGDLFVTETFYDSSSTYYYVRKITPGGDVTTITDGTTLNDARGIVVDSDGYLYVSDIGNSLIRKISQTGTISTLLGSQGVASSVDGNKSTARLAGPIGMSLYGNDIYFTEGSGTIRKFNYK